MKCVNLYKEQTDPPPHQHTGAVCVVLPSRIVEGRAPILPPQVDIDPIKPQHEVKDVRAIKVNREVDGRHVARVEQRRSCAIGQ